jgi:PHD/YefM family antitoxin component YafN of YafNO toxin-antitoxin module
MKGIKYLTDEQGKKTAVVISLKNYKEEVEDFLDGLAALERLEEPSVDFEKAVNKIVKTKASNGKVPAKNKKIG